MTEDGYAAATRILDQAIRDANNAYNQASGTQADMVTGWVTAIGCTDGTDHALLILHPGLDNSPMQAPWITTGLLRETLRVVEGNGTTCTCDDEQ